MTLVLSPFYFYFYVSNGYQHYASNCSKTMLFTENNSFYTNNATKWLQNSKCPLQGPDRAFRLYAVSLTLWNYSLSGLKTQKILFSKYIYTTFIYVCNNLISFWCIQTYQEIQPPALTPKQTAIYLSKELLLFPWKSSTFSRFVE